MSKEYTYILWDCGAMFFIKILENHFNHGIIKMPDNFLCEASLLADLFLHTKGLGWKILAINLGSLKGLNYSCKAIQLLFWIPPRFSMSSCDPWSCLVYLLVLDLKRNRVKYLKSAFGILFQMENIVVMNDWNHILTLCCLVFLFILVFI